VNVTPETRLALDPQLRLKNDVDRAILITRPRPLSDRSSILHRLPPSEAVLFSLMDGDRSLGQVGELWAELTDKPAASGVADALRLAEAFTSGGPGRDKALIEVDGSNRASIQPYDPEDFVIPVERVNLRERRLRIPYIVYFLPTLYCPQKCIYCYAKTCSALEPDLLPLERLREIFEELAGLSVEVIQMTGGEVLAHPRIFEILERVVAAGMTVDIPTKLGVSYEQALRLRELGIEQIQVSLDSSEPDVLDFMVGVKNHHRRAFRVLEALQRAGLRVRVNSVLTPFNVDTAGALVDYVGRLGNVFRLSFSPYGRSVWCHKEELFVPEEALERVRSEVHRRIALYPHMRMSVGDNGFVAPEDPEVRRSQWQNRAYCTANRDGFVLLPDGRVSVCEELYDHPDFVIGNLARQSVMEMWSSPEALALIHPDPSAVPDGPCRTCADFAQCNADRGRCWRDILKAYGWDKPHYPDPRCPLAPPEAARLG
jgi:radical SAM protein with 4Fe4S-binding SPASM domain